ncbi:MAG: hypothetical protein ACRD3W_03430 [Terriglobales bacterium]
MQMFSGEVMFVAVISAPAIIALIFGRLMSQPKIKIDGDLAPTNYWGVYSHNQSPSRPVRRTVKLPDVPHEEIESASHHHTIGVHP